MRDLSCTLILVSLLGYGLLANIGSAQEEGLSKGEAAKRVIDKTKFIAAFAQGAAGQGEPQSSKQITFEIILIDRAAAELDGENSKTPTAEQLLQLEKQSKLASVQRLKLSTLENIEARLQLGEDSPLVTGRTRGGRDSPGFGGGGFQGSESVSYTSLGTLVTITARVEADGKVVAALNLSRSSLAPTKPAEKVEGQEAVSMTYPRKVLSTITTTTRITPGQTTVISGQQTLTGNSPSELWVLISAKVE